MKQNIKKYWSEFKKGTNLMFKEFFNKETNKKQRANMWTFSRLITSFLIPLCSIISILTGNSLLFILSILITGFGGLTDFFDGRSARKYNSTSEFGRQLDQVADKIFSMMVGINLSLFNPMFLITLLGEAMIVGINAPYKVKYNDLKIKSTQIGRLKQWPLFSSLVLGFISTLLPSITVATNISIAITSILQILTAASYIICNNSSVAKLKENENTKLLILEDDLNNKNEKVKTKSIENNNVITNDKSISILEECEQLRKLKNELLNKDMNISPLEEKGFQKTKK